MRYILTILFLLHAAVAWSADTVKVHQDELRRVVESYIQTRTAGSGVQTVVKRLGGLADQELPSGTVTYEVLAPQQWDGLGKTALALIIRVNDQVVRNLPLQADVEGWREVLVAARPLERGTVIQPQDVTMERRNLAQVRGVPLLTTADLVGKQLKMGVRQGAVISGSLVEKVMLVNAGQQVTIILENDAMQLTAIGRAKKAGGQGDLIQVQNLGSLKEFPARVVDARTVRVDF